MLKNKKYNKTLISAALTLLSSGVSAATYKITEISSEEHRHHTAISISETGVVLGSARDSFNFPLYHEEYLLTLDNGNPSFRLLCTNEDDFNNNDISAASLSCIKLALQRDTSFGTQKVGDVKGFSYDNDVFSLINLTDVQDTELGELTRSTIETVWAINTNNIAVGTGSAPFLPIDVAVVDENGEPVLDEDNEPRTAKQWLRDNTSRAAIYVNGQASLIEPEFSTGGGVSSASDISDTGFVAGFESTAQFNDTASYEIRPVIWQLDANGVVIGKTSYGLAFTPDETQTDNYSAQALAVNDAGIAVGYGSDLHSRFENNILTQPLIFRDNETIALLPDNEEFSQGYAVDINNNNVVVGHLERFQFARNSFNESIPVTREAERFFIYDIETGRLSTPETFFSTADSTANAINDAGIVVGEAEYEITTSNVRRRHGFVYDSVNDTFNDINDLTECGSELDIVDLRSINNQNQIVGTALKTVDVRDAKGELLQDSGGNTIKEQVTITVLLDPIPGGEIEDCSAIEDEPPFERRGATSNIWMLFFITGLIAIRRRLL